MRLLEKYKGILIDFDGTIANTEWMYKESFEQFFHQQKNINIIRRQRGKSTLTLLREWGETENKIQEAELIKKEYEFFLYTYFQNNLNKFSFFDDFFPFLQSTHHHPKSIVTATSRSFLELFHQQTQLFEHIEHHITQDDVVPNGKPHPLPYQMGARKLKLLPEECIAIEDSSHGLMSAKSAGCFCIGVQREEEMDFSLADIVIHDLNAISNL